MFGVLEKLGIAAECGRCIAQAPIHRCLVELRSHEAQVIKILLTAAKQLAQEHIVGVNKENLEPAERLRRMDTLLPACRKMMRLKMRQLQVVAPSQLAQE